MSELRMSSLKDILIKEFFERFALGKQTKQPHKSEEKDQRNIIVTIHYDLMGPMRTKSLGSKSQYIFTFVCLFDEG